MNSAPDPVSEAMTSNQWMTKPTDRFVLKWIKQNLSARVTRRIVRFEWIRPWMITVCSMGTGVLAGVVFALGWGFVAGLIAAVSQVLDGVDGQLARIKGEACDAGAFLDSVLDRYSDGALVMGLIIYLMGADIKTSHALILVIGAAALIGSGLVSYSTARAANLGIDLGNPTLASKGTRTTVTAVSALLSPLSGYIPFVGLCYLAVHTNVVACLRIVKAHRIS